MKSANLLLVCLLLSYVALAQDFDYSFRENYGISTPARLTISSSDGNIEVTPGNGSEVQVYFIVRRNGRFIEMSREELEQEDITINVIKATSSLDINVKYPTNYWSLDWRDRLSVDFRIYAPVQTSCDLKTSDGNISLRGLTAGQKLKTSDGNIKIGEVEGDVSGITSDGNIQAETIGGKVYVNTSAGNIDLKNVTGDVESGTSDGDILLANVKGNIRSTTSDGNISLDKVRGDHYTHTSDGDIFFSDLSGSLDASVSDGNIKGNVIELSRELRAKTSDGNIDISVPSGIGMNLYVKGESVNVPLQNFSGRSDDDIIDGKTNGGGVNVNLTTSDGSISLTYQ